MVIADDFKTLLNIGKQLVNDPALKQAIADDIATLEDKAGQGIDALEQHIADWFSGHYALPAPEQADQPVPASPVDVAPVAPVDQVPAPVVEPVEAPVDTNSPVSPEPVADPISDPISDQSPEPAVATPAAGEDVDPAF